MSQNQFHSLKVASVARNTRDAVVVTFDLPESLAGEFAFQPGQYLTLRTRLNGELKQEAPISDMVHDIPSIVAYASSVFTLLPGDVILTGTPSGIGPMKPGDTVEVEVDGVGSLVNPVRAPK